MMMNYIEKIFRVGAHTHFANWEWISLMNQTLFLGVIINCKLF